jgi:phosphoglycolate phosphatase
MPTTTLQAVIFDCDGVLFDSAAANVAYYNAILAELGLPPMSPAAERRAHVLSGPQVLAELFADDPARLVAATRIAAAMDYGPFFRFMVPFAGLHAFLAELRASYRVAMATNRGRTIPDLLRHFALEQAFDAVVGIHDAARPKPHPDMLIECAVRLGIVPAAGVYVGDAEGDRLAASAAGMPFIAVGEHWEHPVRIRTLEELPAALRVIGNGA